MMTVQDTLVLYNIYIISTNFNNPYHLQYIFIEIWVFTYIILIYSLIVNFCRDAVGVDLASLPHLAPQVSRADGCNLLQECADSFVGLTEVAEDEGEDSAKFVEA